MTLITPGVKGVREGRDRHSKAPLGRCGQGGMGAPGVNLNENGRRGEDPWWHLLVPPCRGPFRVRFGVAPWQDGGWWRGDPGTRGPRGAVLCDRRDRATGVKGNLLFVGFRWSPEKGTPFLAHTLDRNHPPATHLPRERINGICMMTAGVDRRGRDRHFGTCPMSPGWGAAALKMWHPGWTIPRLHYRLWP